jgi:transcriptional regulator with XRE-family HTH domain
MDYIRLRQRRILAEIPGRLVASRAAISTGRLSEIERGLVEASPDDFARIEHALDTLITAQREVKARATEVGWPFRPKSRAAMHKNFTMFPNKFIDQILPGLNPAAPVLAVYACRHSGKDRAQFQASLSDVAVAVGLSERTVRRSIPELHGIVSVNHRPATFVRRGIWEEPPPPNVTPRATVRTGADEVLEASGTMVSSAIVSREVARLSGLDRFPRRPEALNELARAFDLTFATPPELSAAITDIIRGTDVCPKPCHVYAMAQREQAASRVGCSPCDGTGFILRTESRETLDGVCDVEMAYPCSCRPWRRAGKTKLQGSMEPASRIAGRL